MTADWVDGEPEVMEPEKLKHWGWYDFNFLPEPLFGCVSNYIDAKKAGKKYFVAT